MKEDLVKRIEAANFELDELVEVFNETDIEQSITKFFQKKNINLNDQELTDLMNSFREAKDSIMINDDELDSITGGVGADVDASFLTGNHDIIDDARLLA